MNANRQFDEDDLVLYAMRLLAEPEHSEVAAFVAANPAAELRVAQIQATLATYAEASVEPQPLPDGSLDRLLSRITGEAQASMAEPLSSATNVVGATPVSAAAATPRPTLLPRTSQTSRGNSAKTTVHSGHFGWAAAIGWALAAMLAVVAGLTLQQRRALHGVLNSRDSQIATLSTDAEGLRRERDTLRATLSSQEQRLANSSSALAATQSQAEALKNEASTARTTAASLSGQASQLSAKLSQEQARAAAAEQEKTRLQGTLAAQADALAALQSATSNAEVMATLTDPSALRVVLTKPKSKPAPVGRAAYIASKGSLVFLANNLQQPKANKVYELWILPADGSNPIPAGTFLPDAKGNAHLVYDRFPRAVPAKGFAITFENAGGATTPTLPLILAGS